MRTPFMLVAYAAWVALFIVWLPGYFTRKSGPSAPDAPHPVWQTLVFVLLVTSFVLLFAPRVLGLRIPVTPRALPLGILGDALAITGVAFAIWARLTLGRNWAGVVVTVREGQALVQSGPYAIVRHPIYTGMLAAMLGLAFTLGTLGAYLGVAAGLVAFLIRVEIEDRLMAGEFGEMHAAYRQRTKKLVPFVW